MLVFKNKNYYIYLLLFLLVLLILSVLNSLKYINFSWTLGYLLGFFFTTLSIFCISFASKELTRNQNPFNYLFFSILRLGIYFVPFLISFYLPNFFSIFGILIGFLNLFFLPFLVKK
ncbi:MG406 family protein [Spiroplasma taiwanense]|uniref:MG406 family protein n=1 Tax=Spiroplasma taiwanense TaxID=2145 RepID=UPI00059FE4E3